MFIVHACDGLVRINLFKNGKVLKRSDSFSGFRRWVSGRIRPIRADLGRRQNLGMMGVKSKLMTQRIWKIHINWLISDKNSDKTDFRFVVTNIRNGHLRFQIVNDDDKAKTIRVWASTDSTTSPYADLPDDTSVKIVGRSCSSTSIQFTRAHDEKVRYCVYRRKENSNFLEQLVSLVRFE